MREEGRIMEEQGREGEGRNKGSTNIPNNIMSIYEPRFLPITQDNYLAKTS
jgi:hypothetical protein